MVKNLPTILADFHFLIAISPYPRHPRILPELLGQRIGPNQVSSCQFPQFFFVLSCLTTLYSFCCCLLMKSSSLPLPPALSGTCTGHLRDHLPSISSSRHLRGPVSYHYPHGCSWSGVRVCLKVDQL